MSTTAWPFDEESFVSSPLRPGDEELWSVALWWLEDDTPELQLLYGWCVPRASRGPAKWSAIDCDPLRTMERERAVTRCVIDGSARVILPFVGELARGESLGDAANVAGLDAPPKRFAACRLPGGPSGSPAALARTPWMLLETAARASARSDYDRGPESPSSELPCLTRSLMRRDISTAFGFGGAMDRPLLAAAAQRLADETGLAFVGSWFERLGSFDFLAFPAAFPDETARVQARVHGKSAIAVSIDLKGLEGDDTLTVRCAQRSNGVTVSDELQTATGPRIDDLVFSGPAGGPFSTTVEVWTRENAERKSRLLFAHTFHWMRQIRLSMNLLAGQATLKSPWLDSFIHARKTRARAEVMANISRVSGGNTSVVGAPKPAFEEELTSRREVRSIIFPRKSNTRFFPVGAGAQSSRLEIAEWFGSLGSVGGGRILVVDPYFDSWGVELIARAPRMDIEWVVVTCLQHRREGGKAAEGRLRAGWAQLAPLLDTRRIRIVDVRSAPPSETRRDSMFHDRYVLVIGPEGRPRQGFNLSNSLQAASANHPLLVTEIGADVIEAVADYVRGLLDVPSEQEVAANSNPGTFTRELLSSPRARQARTTRDAPVNGAVDVLLERVVRSETGDAFASDWVALADVLSRTEGDELFERIAREGGTALTVRLESFILASILHESPLGTLGSPPRADAISLLQFAKGAFANVIREADTYLEHWHEPVGEPWSLYFATRFLARIDPAGLVRVADCLVKSAPASGPTLPEQSAHAEALSHILSALVEDLTMHHSQTCDERMIPALAGADTALLRAIATAYLFPQLHSDPSIVAAIGVVNDPDERILAMAAWVYRLRVDANRSGGVESEPIARLRSAIFQRIEADWRDLAPDGLRVVVGLLSGPIEGSWARSTVNDLLLPLAAGGKQSRASIDYTFVAMVSERIAGAASGRHHFFYSTDANLTEVAADLIATSPPPESDVRALLAGTDRVVAHALRLLARPFVRSTNFEGWAHSREAITWAATFGRLMLLHGAKTEALLAASTVWIGAYNLLMPVEKDPLVISDVTSLGAFARAVEQSIGETSSG